MGRFIMALCWMVTILATCAAVLVLLTGGLAGSATAAAMVVIPYVFSRAVESLATLDGRKHEDD